MLGVNTQIDFFLTAGAPRLEWFVPLVYTNEFHLDWFPRNSHTNSHRGGEDRLLFVLGFWVQSIFNLSFFFTVMRVGIYKSGGQQVSSLLRFFWKN